MDRLINGIWFVSKPLPDAWVMTTHRLGNGHAETSIRQMMSMEEDRPATQSELEAVERRREEEADEREQANKKRAARRAKSMVRRKIKAMGCDALLTLTYRANQEDQARCKVHLREFVRRVRRVLPGFAYVAAFERQKRGAWHVHLAIHRLPQALCWSGAKVKSYSVVRAIWRSVTGDLGGNVDQARRKRATKSSAAKIASYLSKYMMKAFEDGDDWSNRYSASQCTLPKPTRHQFEGVQLRELIDLAYSDIAGGDCECSAWLSPFGDTFFLSTEGLGH